MQSLSALSIKGLWDGHHEVKGHTCSLKYCAIHQRAICPSHVTLNKRCQPLTLGLWERCSSDHYHPPGLGKCCSMTPDSSIKPNQCLIYPEYNKMWLLTDHTCKPSLKEGRNNKSQLISVDLVLLVKAIWSYTVCHQVDLVNFAYLVSDGKWIAFIKRFSTLVHSKCFTIYASHTEAAMQLSTCSVGAIWVSVSCSRKL